MGLSVCTALVATACFAGYEEALSAFKAGDYDRASALFRQFVEEQPQAFVGHVMLGHSLLSAGRPSEAVPPYQQALELKPDDVAARIHLGRALYETDRFDECASALNRVDLEALPTEAQRSMFRLRGACHAHAGNARNAAADLGRLADLKPDDAEARFLQGRWLESDGDFRAAIRAYEQATSIDGNGQEYRHALARALVMAGRTAEGVWAGRSFYSKAAEEAKELVRSHPTSENLILLGEAHLGSTAFRKAGAAFRRVISIDRTNWRGHLGFGAAHFYRRRHKSAEKALVSSLDLAAGNDRLVVWMWLGHVYLNQGRYAEAAAAFEYADEPEAAAQARDLGARARRRAEDLEDSIEAILRPPRGPIWLPGEPPPPPIT